MLSTVLAAWLSFALPGQDGATAPRPSDEQLLAAVTAEVPNGRILSSTFGPTLRGGGWLGCGLIDVGGAVEPFSVFTLWEAAQPERQVISSISVRGADGRMITTAIPPEPAEPAQWKIIAQAPKRTDRDGDGLDRHDRNRDVLDRKFALMTCKDLTPPEGVTWATEPEPDPNPVRGERNRRRAAAAAGAIFGPETATPRPAGQ